MKKKSLLFNILIITLILGIFLAILGFAMGGALRNFSIEGWDDSSEASNELTEMSDTNIQNLDFNLSARSVTLRNGDTFSVSGEDLKKNTVENGTWKLETKLPKPAINVFGFQLTLPFFNNTKNEIVITIPKDINLQDINLKLSAVDTEIATINADTLNISVSAGDLECNTIQAKNAQFSISAGDMDINNFNITESTSISCNAGDVNFGTEDFFQNNLCNNLNLDCAVGDIDICGKLTGKNTLECSMGDINAELVGSKSDYNIVSSSSTLGDISYENEEDDDTTTSNLTNANQAATLKLDCTMGDIDISYR